ncbi:MAG: helix-hairpin-helix domain-containing protein [bacterium]
MEKLKEFAEKNKYWIAGLVISLFIGIGVGLRVKNGKSEENIVFEDELVEEEDEIYCDIYTDISGEVVNPEVYCLDEGSIISDLIELAGGFNGEECKEWVAKELNRAQIIENGQKVYIPGNKDTECLKGIEPITSEGKMGQKISINDATQSEIESLPGIGPSIAGNIISGRPYKLLEDLLEVKGIGEAIFEKIKSLVVL